MFHTLWTNIATPPATSSLILMALFRATQERLVLEASLGIVWELGPKISLGVLESPTPWQLSFGAFMMALS